MAGGMATSIGNLEVHLLGDNSKLAQTIRDTDTMMKGLERKLTRFGKTMTKRVTLPMAAAGVASVKFFSDFDDKMTQSVAIMGQNGKQFRKEMENTAKVLAGESIQSADKLAESYFFLASAGFDAQQSIAALPAVTSFATAGMFDMATATDLLTDAQSALGLTVDDSTENMENMGRVSDVLVKANTLANASVEQFSTALTSKAGTAMKSYNIDLEEGVAVLAAYADQGIKAQNAGNMFDRMLRLTIKSINGNEEAWKQWGIETTDAQGNLLPLADVLQGINEKTQDLGSVQKAAALDMLGFEARSQQAILPLLGLDENIRKYEEDLKNAGGITKEVSENQLKSFASQMKIVWNNVKLAGVEIGEVLAPYVRMLGEQIKRFTKWIQNLNKEQVVWLVTLSSIAALIGPLFIGLGLVAKGISVVISLIGPALGLLKLTIIVMAKLIGVFKLFFKVIIFGFKSLIKLAWAGLKALAPYLPMVAVFTAIAASVWLIVDAFTAADLGIQTWIRSFKVGGTSLGTWWDAFGTYLWQSWDYVTSKIVHFFKAMWAGIKEAGRTTWRILLTIAQSIDTAFGKMSASVIKAQIKVMKAAGEAMSYAGEWGVKKQGEMQEKIAKMEEDARRTTSGNAKYFEREKKKSLANSQKAAEDYYKGIDKLEEKQTENMKKWQDTRNRLFRQDAVTTTTQSASQDTKGVEDNPTIINMKRVNEIIEQLMSERNQTLAEQQEKAGLSELEREKIKNDALLLLRKHKTKEEIELERNKNQQIITGIAGWMQVGAELAKSGGEKQFKIYKAFAMAEAVTSAYLAFNKTLASGIGGPANIPLATSILAMGLLKARQIAMTQPGGGVGGAGGGGGVSGGGFTATPYGAGNETTDIDTESRNRTTIIIENVHGTADEQFADMLAEKIASRSGDGRDYGFETTSS